MNNYKLAVLIWYAVSALILVSQIGKPRKPIEPGTAALSLVLLGIVSWLVYQA